MTTTPTARTFTFTYFDGSPLSNRQLCGLMLLVGSKEFDPALPGAEHRRGLSLHARNALRSAGITFVYELCGESELSQNCMKNLEEKLRKEVRAALAIHDLDLNMRIVKKQLTPPDPPIRELNGRLIDTLAQLGTAINTLTEATALIDRQNTRIEKLETEVAALKSTVRAVPTGTGLVW